MNKFYFRLLALFFIYICAVNICSFAAGFDPRQLINPFYLKERTEASAYLLKNIILFTGVNIKLVPEEELESIIVSAAEEYGIDENILRSVTVRENEFSISAKGGMGLTFISPEEFRLSGYGDPFIPEDNVRAAASAIKRLAGKTPGEESPKEPFYGQKNHAI